MPHNIKYKKFPRIRYASLSLGKTRSYKWIQKASSVHSKGALHRQLGIPESEGISTNMLKLIVHGRIGSHVVVRGKSLKITRLLKERANFALNVRKK